MYGPKHQWVLGYGVPRRSFEERDYHKYNCTKEEALAAAHNYISFDRSYLWSKNEVTTSGLVGFFLNAVRVLLSLVYKSIKQKYKSY